MFGLHLWACVFFFSALDHFPDFKEQHKEMRFLVKQLVVGGCRLEGLLS